MIGHNGGPSVAPGAAWRRTCWTAARAALLPTLPIEVVRLRVRRAQTLGLEYKTYASVRAASGHDLVAFLFSSNALRVGPVDMRLPLERALKLEAVTGAARVALAVVPVAVQALVDANPASLDAAFRAPEALGRFAEVAAVLRAALGKVPGDRVLLVGDMTLERDWVAAGRLAGYLAAERYFGAPTFAR